MFGGIASAQPNGWGRWKKDDLNFQRVATFPVFQNICDPDDANYEDCVDDESYAEILTPTEDGKTVVYIGKHEDDGIVGFVDIKDPSNPKPAGVVVVDGEPTSVAVAGRYALVAVNTSEDFINTSGSLLVFDVYTHALATTIDLGGQPDSVAVSPDKRYAAIAIENERDEDCDCGEEPPQLPAGYLAIIDMGGPRFPWKKSHQVSPLDWSLRTVDLTGYADLFPEDPEPEYVDINIANVAVVTMQENNHLVLVHLPTGRVINDFNAGTVDLEQIDTNENDLIEQTDSLTDVPREADAVTWITPFTFATADEGDLFGGGRGFTIYRADGTILYTSGNELEHLTARVGHYPENRSENKGNEPEGIAFESFGRDNDFLFVASERSSLVAVYKMNRWGQPTLHQSLAGGMGPEGLTAIAKRGLFLTSSENDDRGGTFRSVITIYQLQKGEPSYPTLISEDRADGSPIPWGGLSALAADPISPYKAYTVYDSFYVESRIFEMDMRQTPPAITKEIPLLLNGSPVSLDAEGIAVREGGGFWVASEGSGSCDDIGDCSDVDTFNLLVEVASNGTVGDMVMLPSSVNDIQRSNGFEGVTAVGTPGVDEVVYVAFQRAWDAGADQNGVETRIGRYDTITGEWTFVYYPLDASETPASGDWIGLSELTAIDDTTFVVIERDKQAGTDARVKRLYKFSIDGVTFLPQGAGSFETVSKTLVRDVLPDLAAPNGAVIEKVEGFMVLGTGDSYIVTDNDGTDDSAGETQLINLGPIIR